MTFEQRQVLKQAVSEARRERIAKELTEMCVCAFCEESFVVARKHRGGRTQRYCSPRCRDADWRRTPHGRASRNAARRRRRAAKARYQEEITRDIRLRLGPLLGVTTRGTHSGVETVVEC